MDITKVEQEDLSDLNKKNLTFFKASTGLSSAQIGITITTILLGYTAQIAFKVTVSRFFDNFGVAYALSITLSLILAGIVNLFSMIFGELVPKNIAISLPMKTARAIINYHLLFTFLFAPLIRAFNFIAERVLKLFHIPFS